MYSVFKFHISFIVLQFSFIEKDEGDSNKNLKKKDYGHFKYIGFICLKIAQLILSSLFSMQAEKA